MLRRRKPKTVSEKVAAAIEAENEFNSTDESADEATAPRVEDFDEEYDLTGQAQTSAIRKRNVKLLSEQSARYRGRIAKRKDLEESEAETADDDDAVEQDELAYEESDTDEEEDVSSSGIVLRVDSDNDASTTAQDSERQRRGMELLFNSDDDDDDDEVDENEDDSDEDDEDEEEDEDEDEEESENDEEESDDAGVLPKTDNQEQLRKGACVQNQLTIWEKLLEMRIGLQKALGNANKLPAPAMLQTARDESAELQALTTTLTASTSALLAKQLELRAALIEQNKELRASVQGKRKHNAEEDDENEAADAPPTKRYARVLDTNFGNFHDYRDAVLIKWDDRTRLLAAGGKQKQNQPDYDIIKKVNSAKADMQALIRRSQTPKAASTTDVNIYDDSDFYHQLLRELIDYKTENAGGNMHEVTRQYMELQKMRQKMKKVVDTRASKGRKLRYGVHKKLVNFMAPEQVGWPEIPNGFFKGLFV